MVFAPSGSSGKDDPTGRPTAKVGGTTTRPRPPALWSVQNVVQWFERHCGDLGAQYSHFFHEHGVNGRSLLRMNITALERMGIRDPHHRDQIFREILKLKFKSDILELRDLPGQAPSTSKQK